MVWVPSKSLVKETDLRSPEKEFHTWIWFIEKKKGEMGSGKCCDKFSLDEPATDHSHSESETYVHKYIHEAWHQKQRARVSKIREHSSSSSG